MRFKCLNKDCGKTFMYAAKKTEKNLPKGFGKDTEILEVMVCPYCQSLDFTETIEPQPEAPAVEAVYIYDLATGMQDKLNKLLAEGFEIVARYSKQYHLEKKRKPEAKADLSKVSFAELEDELKRRKEENEDFLKYPEMQQAKEAYEKIDGGSA